MNIIDQGGKQPATYHESVLYQSTLAALDPRSPGEYIDCTVGAGGHAAGILTASQPEGRLLGFDVDPQALAIAHERLKIFGDRAVLVQASYTTLLQQIKALGWHNIQGILIDLGASSMQFDTPDRGFSFQTDGPLDMRFDPTLTMTAADLVNQLSEQELAEIIWKYGEENQSRQIARAIIRQRPLHTTTQLAELIRKTCGGRAGRIHPATKSFQALRIAVNQELDAIESILPQAVQALAPGGRLAVIAFHSLEDRLVKHYFRRESSDCLCPPEIPVCVCGHRAVIKEITRHPVQADEVEMQNNPRARSARLRVAEKLPMQ